MAHNVPAVTDVFYPCSYLLFGMLIYSYYIEDKELVNSLLLSFTLYISHLCLSTDVIIDNIFLFSVVNAHNA